MLSKRAISFLKPIVWLINPILPWIVEFRPLCKNVFLSHKKKCDKKTQKKKSKKVKITTTTKDGFKVVIGYRTPQHVSTDVTVTAVAITKDLPSSTIELAFKPASGNTPCRVRYQLNDKADVGYQYGGNIYVPVNPRLLRYNGNNGPVTSDYVECRVTITGDGSGQFWLGVEGLL